MPLSAHVSMAGHTMLVAEGSRLVFGRGPGADLIIPAGRGLSRRAGVVTAMAAGIWIANISRTHALYVEGDGYRIRLPRMEHDGEPADGWFLHAGTVCVGSRTMLDDGQPLTVTVTGQYEGPLVPVGAWSAGVTGEAGQTGLADVVKDADDSEGKDESPVAGLPWPPEPVKAGEAGGVKLAGGPARAGTGGLPGGGGQAGAGRQTDTGKPAGGSGEGTLLPLYLDPMTKLFLVALIWCRPWLVDPSATKPLPRTPEIARGALEVTGAYHELERFDTDPEYRELLSARVAEHIKVLRRKIADRGLAAADVRLSDEVAVRILIEHGIITSADLSRLDDPAWRSRQEDLWWTQG